VTLKVGGPDLRLWLLPVALALHGAGAMAQGAPVSGLPDPFQAPEYQWGKPAGGGAWGSSAGIERGPHAQIWAIDRCGVNTCDGSDIAPINMLDTATGKPIRSIGAGLFVFPHGLYVDRAGNVWVTDAAVSKDGTKGVQVIELSPDGRVLMRLGTAGVRGDDAQHFHSPTDVVIASNGDIFVADGHAPIPPIIPASSVARIMKFSKDGKFIKQWGQPGSGPSEFNNPHALAIDSRGRLFVADRGNSRIQIFDLNGKFLAEWTQLGRPAGFYIDSKDTLYAIDADSNETIHPGWHKGVWIGSARTGKPSAFVPDDSAGEGVVVDASGSLYGAVNAPPHGITRYAKR
jgi:DNA-binding beta-propeller fold protein YncE